MQRIRNRVCLPTMALLFWVAFITFVGEMTLYTSSKQSKPPLRTVKLPAPFAKLAEDRIWKERMVQRILITIKDARLNNNTVTDTFKSNKSLNHVAKGMGDTDFPPPNAKPIQSLLRKMAKGARTVSNFSKHSASVMKKEQSNKKEHMFVQADSMPQTVLHKKTVKLLEHGKSKVTADFQEEMNYSSDALTKLRKAETNVSYPHQNATITERTIITSVKTNTHPTANKIRVSDGSISNASVLTGAIRKSVKINPVLSKPNAVNASNKTSVDVQPNKNTNISQQRVHLDNNNDNVTDDTVGTAHNTDIFMKDYVPKVYKNVTVNETIHFCVVAAKAEITKEIEILIKSVIVHARRADVMFHFVTDNGPHVHISKIFEDIEHAFVNISYEIVKTDLVRYLEKRLNDKVEITHPWSGIYGVGKIFMYDLLPDVDRCIVVDTDVLFATDPAFLWSELQSRLQPPVAVGVTMYKGDNRFNSGLMLQDLALMRKIRFGSLISMDGCEMIENKTAEKFKCNHDQLLLNNIMKHQPKLFETFTVSWNLGLCFGFRNFSFTSFEDEVNGIFFGAAHLSCLPLRYSNAVEAFEKVRKWQGLKDYVHCLAETDFSTVNWKENL